MPVYPTQLKNNGDDTIPCHHGWPVFRGVLLNFKCYCLLFFFQLFIFYQTRMGRFVRSITIVTIRYETLLIYNTLCTLHFFSIRSIYQTSSLGYTKSYTLRQQIPICPFVFLSVCLSVWRPPVGLVCPSVCPSIFHFSN